MKELQVSKTLLAHQYATMKVQDLADEYGICLARLYKLLDECGIPRKWDKRPHRERTRIVIKD